MEALIMKLLHGLGLSNGQGPYRVLGPPWRNVNNVLFHNYLPVLTSI